MLESGDDVTPQFDKIMPLVPDTVPEINIEPNLRSRSEQLRRASSWDDLHVGHCPVEWLLSSISVIGRILSSDLHL